MKKLIPQLDTLVQDPIEFRDLNIVMLRERLAQLKALEKGHVRCAADRCRLLVAVVRRSSNMLARCSPRAAAFRSSWTAWFPVHPAREAKAKIKLSPPS